MAAALTAASRATNAGKRRHDHSTIANANPETMVMCRPEMLIKWFTPVRVKTVHSPREIACWSPTASATRTPALDSPGNAETMRLRTHSRARSTR